MSRRDSRGSRNDRQRGPYDESDAPLDLLETGGEGDSEGEIVPSSQEDIDDEDVEFLDDDLVVVEATGEVYVGEIGGDDDEEDDEMEKTAVASLKDVSRPAAPEDEEDDGFLSEPGLSDLDATNPNVAHRLLAVADSMSTAEGATQAVGAEEALVSTTEPDGEGESITAEPDTASPDADVADEPSQAEPESVVDPDATVAMDAQDAPPEAQVYAADEEPAARESEEAGQQIAEEQDFDEQAPASAQESETEPASDWELDRDAFGQQAHKLALKERWQELAALTEEALEKASWAREGSGRSALLSDLGRIYRDRLSGPGKAAEVFAELMRLDPASREATEFLSRYYEKNADWQSLYDLMLASAKATWDPAERLERTRRASQMALERLGSADLAVDAWEALWNMGAKSADVRLALTKLYRTSGQWGKLAAFLQEDSLNLEPAERRLQTRQVVETSIYGAEDLEQATKLLDELLAELPSDPLALLARSEVMARQQDWEGLYGLIDKVRSVLSPDSLLSLMRMAAAGLWQGGRLEDATVLYRQILEMNPEDDAAASAVEKALGEAGRHRELLDVFEARLAAIKDPELQMAILAKTAKIADKDIESPEAALEYWRRCTEIQDQNLEAWQAMADLLERLERWTELTEVLNRQLDLRRDPSGRRDVLARLGRTHAYRLENDTAAETCWRDILVLDPSDEEARRELMEIFLRRGEYDALDRAYTREIAMADDPVKALELSRRAAVNAQDNLKDPTRALGAWLGVLDLAPDDEQALSAAVRILTELKDPDRALLFAERKARAIPDRSQQAAFLLETANELAGSLSPLKAKVLYERSLRLSPSIEAALALSDVWRKEEHEDWILTLADFMMHRLTDPQDRSRFASGLAEKISDGAARYRLLRCIATPENDKLLDDLEALAVEHDLLEDYLALLDDLALAAQEAVTFKLRASRLCATKLDKPKRAVALAQETILEPARDTAAVQALEQLAEQTSDYETVMSVYGALVRSAQEPQQALEAIRTQARLAFEKMDEGRRALALCSRILVRAPSDQEAWSLARTIAEKHTLWEDLAALIGYVLPLVDDHQGVELVRERHDIYLGKSENRQAAFHQLVLMARISPKSKLEEVVSKAADKLDQWDCWLPVLEAAHWEETEEPAQSLLAVSEAYQQHTEDSDRTQDLLGFALELYPDEVQTEEKLADLTKTTDRWGQYVDSLRLGAARSSDPERAVGLLHLAASTADEHDDHDTAVALHRRIVAIQPSRLESIDACIEEVRRIADREALQHRLQQWIENAPDGKDKVSKYLELAELALEHAQPEKALLAYAQVLELEPGNETAQQAMDSMSDRLSQEQRLRLLRLEMERAEGERAVEVAMEIATLQEDLLEDKAGAIATLRSLPADQITPKGQARLERLLEEENRWADLADVLEQRAEALEDDQAKVELLDRALSVRLDHLGDAVSERVEELCRKLLAVSAHDERTFVLLSYNLRSQGRYKELAEQLEKVATTAQDPMRRYWALSELGRIYRRGLSDLDEAKRIYELLSDTEEGGRTALLALASLAAEQGTWDQYVMWREKEAAFYPDEIASLVFCHLAEICDVHLQRHTDVLKHYRKARMLDESNILAKNALKALGRRVKDWRKQAALVPESEGGDLEAESNALLGRAKSAASQEEQAEWLWKALVVWPENVTAWDRLAGMARERYDWPRQADLQWSSFQAFERSTAPGERLAEEVGRLHECADAFRKAGKQDKTLGLEHRAFELDPTDARAALAVAEERFAAENYKGAAKLYTDLLERGDLGSLEPERLADLNYKLGECLLHLGRPAEAMEAYTRAVESKPLHSGALVGLGAELMDARRYAEAGRTYLRALVAEERPTVQASVYSRLGQLFEGNLDLFDEAGACYRRALEAGADDLDTLWRALRHLKADGRAAEAEELATRMLRLVEDPVDLASLWVVRGQIALTQQDQEEQATEAFDMALSYDPECREALEGLADVLERKEEWNQLIEILEALQQVAEPSQQVVILKKMGEIARDRFHDDERREAYLKMAAEISPTRDILTELEALYRDRKDKSEELKDILAKLVVVGPPYFEPIVRLGQILLEENRRRHAWVLLSPLAEVRKVDRELKNQLREMRKEFDKAPVPALPEDVYESKVRHPEHRSAVMKALLVLEQAMEDTSPSIDSIEGASKIGEKTGLGRVFGEVSASLGIPQGTAWRSDKVTDTVLVAAPNEGAPQIVLEAEFARRLVQNEVRFVFGHALELARPGNRILTWADESLRTDIFAALQAAVAGGKVAGRVAEIRSIIESAEEDLTYGLDYLAGKDPARAAEAYWQAVQATARRVGLLMAGELHLGLRALERMAGAKSSLQSDTISGLDGRLDGHAQWADMLSFAAASIMEQLLGS